MKRLIVFSATGLVIAMTTVLLIRLGPGVAPAQADNPPPLPIPAEQLAAAERLRFELKWNEAIVLLREVVRRQAEDRASAAKAQARIGKYLLDKGTVEEARSELNYVLDVFGDVSEAVFWARVYLIDVMFASNELAQAEEWATQLADDVTLSPQQRAWGQVKLAEVDLARGFQDIAARKLSDVLRAAGDQTEEPHNWARVRLAELATHNWEPNRAVALADAVVADHGVGKATDQQTVWALYWKSRCTSDFAEATTSLSMGLALAQGRYPDLAFCLEMELGEVCRKAGQYVESLPHYQAAFFHAGQYNPPEQELDFAYLQLGSMLRHLGMKERGLAWLRMGINNPGRLSPSDEMLSARMLSFMTPAESEVWLAFVGDPTGHPDPIRPYVIKEFGTDTAIPTVASPATASRAKYWLGRLYVAEKAWPKAIVALKEASAIADNDRSRGEALTWLAISFNEHHDIPLAMQAADEAANAWRTVITTTENDGDAHYAIDMLAFSYSYNGWEAAMIDALERLVGELSVDRQPSRACFARFRLIETYRSRGRDEQAMSLGEESFAMFLDRPFGRAHGELCRRMGGTLIRLYEKNGNSAKAAAVLSEIEARWPRPDAE